MLPSCGCDDEWFVCEDDEEGSWLTEPLRDEEGDVDEGTRSSPSLSWECSLLEEGASWEAVSWMGIFDVDVDVDVNVQRVE